MKANYFEKSVLGFPITVRILKTGSDWLIQIAGGCAPHIGSISVGYWEHERVKVKTILMPAHRDDVVSELFAGALAERLHSTVAVACGIHYENPGREGLSQIVACTRELLDEILKSLS